MQYHNKVFNRNHLTNKNLVKTQYQNTDFNRIHLTNKNWVKNLVKMQCHYTDFDQINLTNKKSKNSYRQLPWFQNGL